MSKKERKQAQPSNFKNPFSPKETEIIRQELADPDAVKNNIPVLSELFFVFPELRALLFDSYSLIPYLASLQQSMAANVSISGKAPNMDAFYTEVIRRLAPSVHPEPVLDTLLTLSKEAKIKREKRALLWAGATLAAEIGQKVPLHQSPVIRCLIIASVQKASEVSRAVSAFVQGQEPFSFDHQKVADHAYGPEELTRMVQIIAPLEPDFSMGVAMHALGLFERVKRDFGLRFYQILHYPTVPGGPKRRLILLPGESQAPQQASEEERAQRMEGLMEAMHRDFPYWLYRDFAPELIAKIKTASFGELPPQEAQVILNAAAYCLLIPQAWSPFLMKLYEVSGDKAESVNPPDELTLIQSIKDAPDRMDLYRRYGDLLYNKQELAGALITYYHIQSKYEEKDPELEKRIEEIQNKLREQAGIEAETSGEGEAFLNQDSQDVQESQDKSKDRE